MPACAACGQENPDVARFCLACGAALEPAAQAREERRVVTVVFVDLVGFTARSEQLDPEDVRAILTRYYDKVRAEFESYGGVVEKFIGDAVMAIFGAPTTHGDDPERAVRAALAVRDAVAGELDVRIAVNTGNAVVALDARPGRGEAMVAGDVVNTAARMQQAAGVGGVVVGEGTHRATRDVIRYERAEPLNAKGKAQPIPLWIAVEPLVAEGERPLSRAPLVGRDRELGLLRDLWERAARERRPHLVTIVGPSGLGKTRLAVEFARTVEAEEAVSVRGRSLPYREHSAYGPFATQVKTLAGIFDSDATDVAVTKLRATASRLLGDAESVQVAEHLAILLGFGAGATAPDRDSLFASARFFVEAVARDMPTLIVFEDIHWADDSLLDLIEHFARLHDLPLLLLTLARPELLDLRPTWGGGLLGYTALPLDPLSEAQSLELARALLPDGDLAAVTDAAEGNPLFIEQLAAVLRDGETSSEQLPTTIRDLVAARLDALPGAERSLLLDAAVVGKVFWRGAVERLAGGDVGETLASLERRDLIRREPMSSIEGEEQYFFKHVLIREVAYELLPRERRRRGHAEVAKFVEASTPEVGEAAAALARHWLGAGDPKRATDYFIAAAEEAERGWAKDLAVALYKEALELVATDEERRRFLRKRLAVAQQAWIHTRDAQLLRQESPRA
ncbi:MAG TPA: AAA family ATPase [Gaiellaceae bacterium]|nr:AAA family ATPase [Gaiellaceae bacterium]